jgi:Fe-S cluster assembly iron-binding protein IscA
LEVIMIEVTDNARKELDAYFADKEKSPIRIYLAMGGCSGPRLGLALDEPGAGDEQYPWNGYTFVMAKELAQDASFVKIDMTGMGFAVSSDLPLPEGGGCGCGSGSSGGCGTAGGNGGCGCSCD